MNIMLLSYLEGCFIVSLICYLVIVYVRCLMVREVIVLFSKYNERFPWRSDLGVGAGTHAASVHLSHNRLSFHPCTV